MVSRRTMITLTAAAGAVAASSPWWRSFGVPNASAAPSTCELALVNDTDTAAVNAYVTGREFGTGRMMLLRAGGQGPYYLEQPPGTNTPLPVDASIPLAAPGAAPVVVTLPRMYGARVYFVRESTLEFFVNPGPALVEPALHNRADANFGKIASFCEFTFNDVQLFANVSYVDLVTALPIGMRLQGDGDHSVAPLPRGAVEAVAAELEAQQARDGHPWGDLVMRGDSGILRVMSPQNVMAPHVGQPDMPFADYWNGYADQVWDKYRSTDLRIDLQGGRGVLTGRVNGDTLVFNDGSAFAKPGSWDVFTCNHGPFANIPSDSEAKKGALARLAAAFNRSTIHSHADQPNGPGVADFYDHGVTNHYARAVHANSPIGYAFPYDDVTPDGTPDQSGVAFDGNPRRWTLTVT